MKIYDEPKVTLLADQVFYNPLEGEWETDAPSAGEALAEFSGRLCYMSFGPGVTGLGEGHATIKGRVGNDKYLNNIKTTKHGSVVEHSVVTLLIEGVSRSLTHELIRHRAGMSFSQLSQRYVDESGVAFVKPPEFKKNSPAYYCWVDSCQDDLLYYKDILTRVNEEVDEESQTMKKKRVRQAARSVLPNCTETKIVVTGNVRAWRHFLEMRGAEGADIEIRVLAAKVAELLKERQPNMFDDVTIVPHTDGTNLVTVYYSKV